jgi:hypothetical protein
LRDLPSFASTSRVYPSRVNFAKYSGIGFRFGIVLVSSSDKREPSIVFLSLVSFV